jgi:hypothetical protein
MVLVSSEPNVLRLVAVFWLNPACGGSGEGGGNVPKITG